MVSPLTRLSTKLEDEGLVSGWISFYSKGPRRERIVGNSEESNEAIRSGEYTSVFDYTIGNLLALQQGEVTLKVQSNQMESEIKIQINE